MVNLVAKRLRQPESEKPELLAPALIKIESRLKILYALAKKDERWKSLVAVTGLSRRTLYKHLPELLDSGYIIKKPGKDLNGSFHTVYSLSNKKASRKTIMLILRQIDDYGEVSVKLFEYREYFFLTAKKKNDITKKISEYFRTMNEAVNYVLTTELTRKKSRLPEDKYISLKAFEIIQQILHKDEFMKRLWKETRHELEESRERSYRYLESHVMRLGNTLDRMSPGEFNFPKAKESSATISRFDRSS